VSKKLDLLGALQQDLNHRVIPLQGLCPYCESKYQVSHWNPRFRGTEEAITWPMIPVEWLCTSSKEYRFGYRARWKCLNPRCGEQEIR
jgi:hypothetical protein